MSCRGGGGKHKKEKPEKKKHRTEDKSQAKPEGTKAAKREERKEEARTKKKKTEEGKEEEKKEPKGKSKRIAAQDDRPEDVLEIKAEPARMAAVSRRAPRSTHLEVKDDPGHHVEASGSSCKSGSSNNNTSSSRGNSSNNSESEESAKKSPVHEKGALKAAKTQALEKRKERAEPHFLVQTHGRAPSKVPIRQTRHEKFTASEQHVRCIAILKSFFSNEYGFSRGTFIHHYKNCCGQLNSATAVQTRSRAHIMHPQPPTFGGFHRSPMP